MLLPNAQDASAKTYNYSHCAPQFCCGVPSPSRPRHPSRPFPSVLFPAARLRGSFIPPVRIYI